MPDLAAKNNLLIQLSESGRFWRVEFDQLTAPEQVFLAIWELEAQVNNGGFKQYYFNSSGDTAFAIVDALVQIGASEMARIVREANQVFDKGIPPIDREERQRVLDALTENQKNLLERLDAHFFRYPDDLTSLLYEFVHRNVNEVEGAADVGI